MSIVKFIGATRYLAIVPIIGLAVAAAVMFAFGGIGLIMFVIRSITEATAGHAATVLPIFELLEYVHQFLIGTVLYITAMGLYQLFIQDVPLPMWMKTESSEDLETNLIGVTVVVLAIEFLGAVFSGRQDNLLEYGAGIALPIAALGVFMGLKHRGQEKQAAKRQTKRRPINRREAASAIARKSQENVVKQGLFNHGEEKSTTRTTASQPPTEDRTPACGRNATNWGAHRRQATPRSAHAEWQPPRQRDPLALLAASNVGRTPSLVPVRHGRMLASPFAFYRGAPAVMAYDLAQTPSSGIVAQLCGDCHISNFGMFASPERSLVFDLNDFDETLPGPFEWDVKRTAASIVVAARNAQLSAKDARAAVALAMRSYRTKMAELAAESHLGVWYSHTTANTLLEMVSKRARKAAEGQLARVQAKDRLRAFSKLTEVVDGKRRIIHEPPLIFRLEKAEDDIRTWLTELFTAYYESLEDSRKRLLSRYRLVDVAHKVVGVGSVGTRCFISYWQGVDEGDPLFLQVKQASASLLEPYLGPSEYAQPGQRVVTGQRLMQAANDIFLGYTHSGGHDYFVRQLYDMKGSADLERISGRYLERYAALCGAVLARAHARTGDAAQIAGYLGKGDSFDTALVEFAVRYADQNDADYALFKQAAADGRIEAAVDEPTA